MPQMTRRELGGAALLLSTGMRRLAGAGGIDAALRSAIEQRKIPAARAMVATADSTTYSGAFGKRDTASGVAVTPDSIFSIASMTKAITTTAALQLVDQ